MAAIDWKEVLGWTDDQIQELRVAGYSYLTQGVYDRAITFFEGLVSLDPTNAFDLQTLGALYLQTGDPERALEWLNKSLAVEPTALHAQINKAKALLGLNRREEGLNLCRTLVTVDDVQIRESADALLMAYS